MPRREPPVLRVGSVFREGLAGFGREPTSLLVRSAYLMAVPTAVLLVSRAADNYWADLAVWLLGLALGGYAAWPLSRSALAVTSSGRHRRPSEDDWWVRDGFVRASVTFYFTVAVGTLLLFVPGIMVLMIYSLYPFLIIERKARGFEALALSSELTRGNRLRLLQLLLICLALFVPAAFLLYRSGTSPLGVIGMLVAGTPALAVGSVTWAAAYRTITRN
ncbi:MAG: hypothetical protein OXJ36_04260 [bacterium]|nr:hypothetical protein [bacterium]